MITDVQGLKMSKQGARDGRSLGEHGIIGSPNMIEAIAKYEDKVIEKLAEQQAD